MGKWNCCVPGCTNNWRNSSVKFHRIPVDTDLRVAYDKLLRNDSLKISSSSTRICGAHFQGGERICRSQLPSIFPWSKEIAFRREILKHSLPVQKPKRRRQESQDKEDGPPENDTIPLNEHIIVTNQKKARVSNLQFLCLIKVKEIRGREHTEMATLRGDIYQIQTMKEVISSQENQIKILNDKIKVLEDQVGNLNYKLQCEPTFHLEYYKKSNENITFYSGFPTYNHLLMCFDLIKEKAVSINYGKHVSSTTGESPKVGKLGRRRKLSKWEEFTMVLLRLRLGLLERDLAHRFKVSVSTVSVILRCWLKFLRAELEPLCIHWPNKELIKSFMLKQFDELCPELVSIIDCTEIRMDSPSSLDNKAACYSSYKSHSTMKALVGITPNGVVSFMSELYSGAISDPEIVRRSGYLQMLKKGDVVMADKGFLIQDDLAHVGASLVMPNFLKAKGQFTEEETTHNKKIASLRIHVERCMERLKNWHIFDRSMPISLADTASDMWIIVACISNFWPPLIN